MFQTGDYDQEMKTAYGEDVYDLDAEARLSIEAYRPANDNRQKAYRVGEVVGTYRTYRPVMDIAGWN